MMTEDQSEVVKFLADASTYGGEPVERVDTHTAIVFLAGTRALKLKRAVRFDYLDFSTAARRQICSEAEVRLNRRTAPALYLGVVPVTREEDGALALGGRGSPIEWLIEMRRFDQSQQFDRLAEAHRLDLERMPALGRTIARFHAGADPRRDLGGAAAMRRVVDGNDAGLEEFGRRVVPPETLTELRRCMAGELDRWTDLLDRRRDAGWVRQCHGDLHLGNIVLIDDQPTLFDAIEFNDDIATTDVCYDVAFVLMDLWRRELPGHANALWNGYLAEADDESGLPLMPFFLACRAAVRAKTSLTAAGFQQDPEEAAALQNAARVYLDLAMRLLHPPAPALIAIGGLSGSGKSTVARAIAASVLPVPGAVVVRTDELRKRAFGVAAGQRLEADAYSDQASHHVYSLVNDRAARLLSAGCSVIADAVFARSDDRGAIERVAMAARAPFAGVWLDAPARARLERVAGRTDDVSDADTAVAAAQNEMDLGAIGWDRVNASPAASEVVQAALTIVNEAGAMPARGVCTHR